MVTDSNTASPTTPKSKSAGKKATKKRAAEDNSNEESGDAKKVKKEHAEEFESEEWTSTNSRLSDQLHIFRSSINGQIGELDSCNCREN